MVGLLMARFGGHGRMALQLRSFSHNLIDIPIPRVVLKDEFFKLDLKIHSPTSPKALGLGDDDRQLGIGAISAVFQ